MSSYLIKGGRIVDPSTQTDTESDVLIRDDIVEAIAPNLEATGAETIDATGLVVAPGFVDLHTHVREPGREDEETIASASRAAAAGGYTAIVTMPNTDPVADTAAVVEKVWALGRHSGLVDVRPAGALTKGQKGSEMADLGEMAVSPAKVVIFTDDGHGLQNALLARRVMEYLRTFDAIYAEHCEDAALAANGQMHEGERSAALGLRGVPAEAEELMAARDIALSRLTGCRLHLLHISTAGTVELVRRAKADGLRVTAEATPHHFSATDELLESYDPNAKVNPPLRTEADRQAVIAGLADGTIDAIATDHAPHAWEEKDAEFLFAPPGLIGLETALALGITELVEPGLLSLVRVIELMSSAPAAIAGLDRQGSLAEGGPASLTLFDPKAEWTVDAASFHSKSRNTPFEGRTLRGRVVHTFYEGRRTVKDGIALEGSLV
jgi:dihydroorotase